MKIWKKQNKGFTLIETLIILAILGVMLALGYPAIRTNLEKRKLDDTGREILTTLQRAKFQAIRNKTIYSVSFDLAQNSWTLSVYNYTTSQWDIILTKQIPSPLTIDNISLPDPDTLEAINVDDQVVFNSLGFADREGTITLQNPNLTHYVGVEDLRLIRVMIGGSINIEKQES
ncbi:MAG: GspH/FimT family pseudopilin [Candidatus Aminicenantia bacterium]